MPSEKEELQRELEYLSNLIKKHKTALSCKGVGGNDPDVQVPDEKSLILSAVRQPVCPPEQQFSSTRDSEPLAENSSPHSADACPGALTVKTEPSSLNMTEQQLSEPDCVGFPIPTLVNNVVQLSGHRLSSVKSSGPIEDRKALVDSDQPQSAPGLPTINVRPSDISKLLAVEMRMLYQDKVLHSLPTAPGTHSLRFKSPGCPRSVQSAHENINSKARIRVSVPSLSASASRVLTVGSRNVEWQATNPVTVVDCNPPVAGHSNRHIVITNNSNVPFTESLLVTTTNNRVSGKKRRRARHKRAKAKMHVADPVPVNDNVWMPDASATQRPSEPEGSVVFETNTKASRTLVVPDTPRNQSCVKSDVVFVPNPFKLVRKAGGSSEIQPDSNPGRPLSSVVTDPHQLAPTYQSEITSSPSLMYVNKYKLVRKRKNLSASADVKPSKVPLVDSEPQTHTKSAELLTGPKLLSDVSNNCGLPEVKYPCSELSHYSSGAQQCANKVFMNKYKLIRKRSSPSQGFNVACSPGAKSSAESDAGVSKDAPPRSSSLLMLNKYKLVRRKSLSKRELFGNKQVNTSGWMSPDSVPSASQIRKRTRSSMKKRSFSSKYALKRNAEDAETEFDINRVLGRKVKNLSHNKYKFVNAYIRRRGFRLPRNSLLKIDRRKSSERMMRAARRSSSGSRRLSSGTRWSIGTSSLPRTTAATRVAQRIVNQMRWSAADQRRKAAMQARTYCMYFNRFGRCSRGEKCQFIHDPDKVSVCTRFLRGTCKVTDCPFSHRVAPDKMPTCRYFLQGVCSHDDCPYRHVRVAKDAGPCLNFARGYCHLGDTCKKNHILICPDFATSDGCRRGKRCPLRHVEKSSRSEKTKHKANENDGTKVKDKSQSGTVSQALSSEIVKAKKPNPVHSGTDISDDDDITLPMKHRHLPSFIAIDTSDSSPIEPSSTAAAKSSEPVVLSIRPRLAPPSDSTNNLSWLLDL